MKEILVYVRHLTMTSILTYNSLQGQCCPVEFSVMMEIFSICAAWHGSCGLHVAMVWLCVCDYVGGNGHCLCDTACASWRLALERWVSACVRGCLCSCVHASGRRQLSWVYMTV